MTDVTTADYANERIIAQRKANEHLQRENARMRAALLLIVEWKLPYRGFSWENGSNGARDFFRGVAREALQVSP